EREGTDVDFYALAFQRLLGLADPRDFRVGIDDRRNQVVVHLGFVARDALSNHYTLFRGLVGEHGAAYYVTDGVDARDAGSAVVINEDKTTLVHINAGVSSEQIGGHWATANRNDQLVEGLL